MNFDSRIPDSPAEPDAESHPMTDPKIIPLDDPSGSKDATFDYSATPWPDPKPEHGEMEVAQPAGVLPYVPTGYAPTYPGYQPATQATENWRVRIHVALCKKLIKLKCLKTVLLDQYNEYTS